MGDTSSQGMSCHMTVFLSHPARFQAMVYRMTEMMDQEVSGCTNQISIAQVV